MIQMNLSFIFWHALPDGKRNLNDWQGHVSGGFADQVIHTAALVNTLQMNETFFELADFLANTYLNLAKSAIGTRLRLAPEGRVRWHL